VVVGYRRRLLWALGGTMRRVRRHLTPKVDPPQRRRLSQERDEPRWPPRRTGPVSERAKAEKGAYGVHAARLAREEMALA
jgi:hypothetical protein